MFDLEKAVLEWRQQTFATGIKTPATLDELQQHVREDVRAFIAAGKTEEQAFQLATARLGSPNALRTEFDKMKKISWWPVTIGYWLFLIASVLMVGLLGKKTLSGKADLLLCLHIFTITVGYGAAFVAGGFGIAYVVHRLFHEVPPNRQRALDQGALLFCQLAAGLLAIGWALGEVWARKHMGELSPSTVNAKAIGALGVIIWFAALSWMQRSHALTKHATMVMCIGGNIVASLAWFGIGILVAQIAGFWPLMLSILLGIHFVFLIMGMASTAKAAS